MVSRIEEYAEGDADFASWLERVDAIVSAKVGLGLMDLEDMGLRDEWSSGTTPEQCVSELVADTVEENYGEEYADLLR